MLTLSDVKNQNDKLRIIKETIKRERNDLIQARNALIKQHIFSEIEYINGCIDTYNEIEETIELLTKRITLNTTNHILKDHFFK